MTLPSHDAAHPGMDPPPGKPSRLTSWKEIAAYFDRDVRTVQLWEKNESLPVHRLEHIARSSVYAYPQELERWLAKRHRDHAGALSISEPEPAPHPQPLLFPALPRSAKRPRHRVLRWSAAATLTLFAVAGLILWRAHHRSSAASEITVVLADFVNTTGEAALDNALDTALLAKLQQTPFLVFMPQASVQQALRYMGRPATEHLNLAVAQEVCLREGGQVVLQGSITNTAAGYTVTVRALRCADGKPLAERSATADGHRSVLSALDHAAEALRPDLGESAASIRTYKVKISDATTGSLDALLAYSQGDALWNAQGESVALPYFQRAVQMDPNFAMAYERMGTIYGNRGDSLRSQAAIRKAWELRDRVTERERFYLTSHLYGFVTGETEKEMQTYIDWGKVYPHDDPWMIDLSVDYGYSGQFDKAIALQRRVIQENPGISYSYGDLAGFYLAEERPDEARAVLDQALQAKVQDPNTQLAEYSLAFYRNDFDALHRMVAATAREPGIEDVLLAQQAMTEDSRGRIAAGRAYAVRAAAIAAAAHDMEIEANWLSSEAVRQAEMGNAAQARLLLGQAMAVPVANKGRSSLLWMAQAHALLGDTKPTQAMLDTLDREYPLDTLIQSYWLPILRARLALDSGQYGEALRLTDLPNAYDLGIFAPGQCMDLAYLRGQTLLAAGQPSAAAQEFRAVLTHRGLVLNCPTLALSRLGLARALAASGDAAGSRSAYQDLFVLWKDADAGLPLLRQAQTEYRSLDR